MSFTDRTQNLIGADSLNKLNGAKVALFGIGGVGSFVAEALVRVGIGEILLVDGDVVSESNINRQLVALYSTIGKSKAEVMKKRALDINPDIKAIAINKFLTTQNIDEFDLSKFDYVIDAIDDVKAKIMLITACKRLNIPIISAMGAGNKLNPTKFRVSDIYKTSVCPLARVMRHELKKNNVDSLKVVFSDEEPYIKGVAEDGKIVPASISFVPSVMGEIIASEVVKDLIEK